MSFINRVSKAICTPKDVIPFFSRYMKSAFRLIKQGKIAQMPLLVEHALGVSYFIQRDAVQTDYGPIIETNVFGNRMWVFADDRGISRDLLIHGERETQSTNAFIHALNKLSNNVDNVTILDIGANIGYYTLIEAKEINSGKIYAIEPEPRNYNLLERNIDNNRYSELVTTERAVIGKEPGTAELELSNHSNTHRVKDVDENIGAQTLTVRSHTIDSFLNKYEISKEEVCVVRMDIEGFETKIIDQLKPVFSASREIVLFIELHHKLVPDEEYQDILNSLIEAGFEPVSAVYNTAMNPSWDGKRLDIDSLSELNNLPSEANCIELVARRSE